MYQNYSRLHLESKRPFKRVHQLNKTELLVCVAPGWSKTLSQFLNLIDSFRKCSGHVISQIFQLKNLVCLFKRYFGLDVIFSKEIVMQGPAHIKQAQVKFEERLRGANPHNSGCGRTVRCTCVCDN